MRRSPRSQPGISSTGLDYFSSRADKAAKFDVQTEFLDNGAVLASGLQLCVAGLTPGKHEVTVPWGSFSPQPVAVGDVLSLRVSTRIGTNPDGSQCAGASAGGLKLYYDAPGQGSNFSTTITPDPSATLYLHGDGVACGTGSSTAHTLSQTLPKGTPVNCDNVPALTYSASHAWTDFGTWSLPAQCACSIAYLPAVRNNPPAPAQEPISVSELPLPPTAPSATAGSCTNATGCISTDV